MRRTALLMLGSLGFSFGLAAGAAPPASAVHTSSPDSSVTVPLTAFRDIVVDDAHGHVFLTGAGSQGVVVRDLEGGEVTTITNEPGASQMALSEDGGTLYVALYNGDAVSAISTTSLTESTRYETGQSTCPSTLAVTSGKVWFGYGCASGSGSLGVLDPAAQPPTVALATVPLFTFYNPPVLSASAAQPGLLLAGEQGSSRAEVRLVDVSTGTPLLGASRQVGANLQDLAVTPDGSHVITAAGSPYYHPSYRTSDLSGDGVYGTTHPYPTSVALAAGLVVAGVDALSDKDVYVYRTDGTLIRSYEVGGPDQGDGRLQRAALAITADATRLYAVSLDSSAVGGAVRLHVLHDPGPTHSWILLTEPATARVGSAFSVTGSVQSPSPVAPGAVVTIQRDSSSGTVDLPATTTGADGSFTISDTVTQRGSYGYTASWGGDATHAGASERVLVTVSGLVPLLSIPTGAGPYAYGAKPLVVAHLGTTTTLRTLSIYAQPYGGTKSLLKTGTVDANGNVSVPYTVTRRTTFSATFAGDDTYEPRSVAKALTSHASVASALGRAYGTSGSYKLFHTYVDPELLVSVAPNNAGACVTYVVQLYYSGGWHNAVSSSCRYLDSTSRGAARYYANPTAGVRFRMRATFAGNTRNVTTTGAWQYGAFTT